MGEEGEIIILSCNLSRMTASKTPTSRIRGENKNCKWGTASKSPIGSTNMQ